MGKTSKCIVTGHCGYIGHHIYNKLVDSGHEACGIDLKQGENILDHLPNGNFDYVFHLATQPRVQYSVENPSKTFKQNAYATSVLLE